MGASIVKKMPLLIMNDTKRVLKPGVSHLLAEISRFLSGKGTAAYLVGGFVRDTLLNRPTADIDIAVGADAVRLAPELAKVLGGKAITLDAENRISRIVLPGREWELDLTSFSGSIEQDLARRDFNVNAIACELEGDVSEIDESLCIDPFSGREDLRRSVIRAVDTTTFTADPARLLRAVRIAAELGFTIEPGTEDLIKRDCGLIAGVAGERTREEFLRLLTPPGAAEMLFHLDRLGLLTALIPELGPARGIDQPRIHVWDVLEHSIRTVAGVEFVLHKGGWDYVKEDILSTVPWSEELRRHFEREVNHGSTHEVLVKLAGLLHDIAKPATKTVDDDGRARFLGHPQQGAETAAGILERLRFSRRETQLVSLMVKYHMRPTQMSNVGLPTGRAIYRFFRDTGDTGIDILYLCLADHLATRGDTLDINEWRGHAFMTGHILQEHYGPSPAPRAQEKFLDGHAILETFGLEPGPRIGQLLESLREAQAAGEVTDRQQAINHIRQMLSGPDRPRADRPSQGEK